MEEEEEPQFSDAPSTSPQMDTDHEADKESEGNKGSEGYMSRWKSTEEGVKASLRIDQCWHARNWESVMEESEGLALDDPCSGSDTTITGVDSPSAPLSSPHDKSGDSPPTMSRGSAPHSQESSIEAGEMPLLTAAVTTLAFSVDAVDIHVSQSELDHL